VYLRRLRVHGFSLAFTLSIGSFTSSAGADTVSGTRSEELVERAHDVRITLHPDHAELLVRRTVYNGGPRHDQAEFMIDVPEGAVATGLRTLGTLAGRPHWFNGELMEAEAAAAKYRELTGIGGYYPKDPALLSWRHSGLLALQVFPCPPKETKSVEYTLKIPLEYHEGKSHLSLPALGTEALTAGVRAWPADARDRLTLDGAPLESGAPVRLRSDENVDLALIAHDPPTFEAELAVMPFAERRNLVRFELSAAPRVAAVPRNASIVVAIDGSRSVTPENAGASLTAAGAYLSHFKDAEVEVLVFNRKVKRRYGRFVPVATARADLAKAKIELENGSDVDGALREAERLLATAAAGRARRIVVITDGLVRSALKPEKLRAALSSSRAITHLALFSEGSANLERDDLHPWAAAARQTGGLVWHAQAPETIEKDDTETRPIYEELARPLRIDRVRIYSADIALREQRDPPSERLDEGEGFTDTWIAERKVSSIRAEGELWSQPISANALPDAAKTKLWSALVFGTDLLGELSEPEMMTLARFGGAVSPVTSYLAIEPGVRPSTEGLEETEGIGLGGVGTLGSGRGMGVGHGYGGARFDHQGFLDKALAAAWQRCGGKPGTAKVTLENTQAEVVDVPSARLSAGKDAALERCLAEAAWSLTLPDQFNQDWETWTVEV